MLILIAVLLVCIFGALLFIGSELRWLSTGLALIMEHIGIPKVK